MLKRVVSALLMLAVASVSQAAIVVKSSLIITNLRLVHANGDPLVAGTDYVVRIADPGAMPGPITASPSTTIEPSTLLDGSGYGSADASSTGDILSLMGLVGITTAELELPNNFTGPPAFAIASITRNSSFIAARDLVGIKAVFDVESFVDITNNEGVGLNGGNARGSTTATFGVSGFTPGTFVSLTPPADFNLIQTGLGRSESGLRSFTTNSFDIENGITYGFTASQQARTRFTAVPEPACLCFLGAIGLLGFVAHRRQLVPRNG